ncbi:MAG: VWA domain-containing protein [Rhodobacteraceae bacterium]|nr:VWA domain-containing protein [Paracoccaceae bacterium]
MPSPLVSVPARLARDPSGSLSVLAVFVFVAMLLVAGLAVDMMRHETVRLRLQDTTDRAVLAATMLRGAGTDATPEQIVRAYFAAEGLSAQLAGRIDVVENSDGRTVTVAPAATVPSLFLSLVGVDSLPLTTLAQANEAVQGRTRIDLVMVLDISGSMGSAGKIDAMRSAAATLARSLLADNDDGHVALSIVPYDAWVLPPPGMLSEFASVTGNGACNDWTVWNSITNSLTQPTTRAWCDTASWAQVRPFLHDPVEAAGYINGLQARGTTSIDLGVRHGALFFDPSLRPAVAALIDTGQVAPQFRDHPLSWDEPGAVRALVLLTDGQNCCGERYSQMLQDANTLAVCSELKARDVLIYAIAFQAPAAGAALMQGCASSENHFFNADVGEILSVFEGIGANIQTRALRLTL